MSDIVKYDENRVLKYYEAKKLHLASTETIIRKDCLLFLIDIEDLSEEFHIKYSTLYNASQWTHIIRNQTNLSEQFYKSILHNLDTYNKSQLIISKRVSEEFIKNNSEAFDQKVWEEIYSNV